MNKLEITQYQKVYMTLHMKVIRVLCLLLVMGYADIAYASQTLTTKAKQAILIDYDTGEVLELAWVRKANCDGVTTVIPDFDAADKEISLLPKEINNDDERVIKATYNPTSSVQANTNASTGENTEAETFFNLVNNSVFGNGGLAILEYIGNLSSWGLSPWTGTVPSRIYLELYLTTTNSLFATSASGANSSDRVLLMTVDIFSNGVSNDIGLLEQRVPIVTNLQGFTEATSSWSTIEFGEVYNDGNSVTKTNKAYFLRTLANDGTRAAENMSVRIRPKLILEYADSDNSNGGNMPYYGRVDNYTSLIRKIR